MKKKKSPNKPLNDPKSDSIRVDGWGNVLTGAGTLSDKRTYTKYTSKNLMSDCWNGWSSHRRGDEPHGLV